MLKVIKYRAGRHTNRIVEVMVFPNHTGDVLGDYFKTWEEAHQWLVADRAKQVDNAEHVLKRALASLAKAERMQQPRRTNGHAQEPV